MDFATFIHTGGAYLRCTGFTTVDGGPVVLIAPVAFGGMIFDLFELMVALRVRHLQGMVRGWIANGEGGW